MSDLGGEQFGGESPMETGAPGSYVADDLQLERERRQKMTVIGLASVGGVVLLIGLVAFLLTRDGGSSSTASVTPSSTTTIVATTAPATSTTSTSTTTTTTTTTTTIPIPSSVDAGPDLLAGGGQVVTLAAVDVGLDTPDEYVRWVQTAGPDVTAGVGALGGPTVSFTAPDLVGHISFDLIVADPAQIEDVEDLAEAAAATDDVVVRLVEDAERAVFVDGERGDDAAAGTIDAPLKTLPAAVATGSDIYVRSVGRYDATSATIELGDGMDLYGGYDAEWFRDPLARAVIDAQAIGMVLTGAESRVIASIELLADDAPVGIPSAALVVNVDADVEVRIEDSRLVAGTGGGGTADEPIGRPSLGIDARGASRLEILRTTVNSATAGAGWSGSSDGGSPAGPAAAGANATGRFAASGAGDGRVSGGDGGDGGVVGDGDDSPSGASGGTAVDPDGDSGRGGAGGSGGAGGDGARLADGDVFAGAGATGDVGGFGESGVGGGGGGGGAAFAPAVGGGGGAGGLGGQPGAGGSGGGGGGGSVGLRVGDVDDVFIIESLVASGAGGTGGSGAVGQPGESGGLGGDGAAGDQVLVQTGGNGGPGGGGAGGGAGGQGGGGAGGSSYALLTDDVGAITIVSSDLRAGSGGAGGSGGQSGAAGLDGAIGSGVFGGASGTGGAGNGAGDLGRGADGGSSVAWLDLSDAQADIDDSRFEPGSAGSGGSGTPRGDSGTSSDQSD